MDAGKAMQGAYDEARQFCEKSMVLSPSDANVRINAAGIYNMMGEHEHALQLLNELDVLDPFVRTGGAVIRIIALYCLGRFDEALAAALRVPLPTEGITVVSGSAACGTGAARTSPCNHR